MHFLEVGCGRSGLWVAGSRRMLMAATAFALVLPEEFPVSPPAAAEVRALGELDPP